MTTNQIFVFSHFNIYVYSQQILSCFALFLTSFKFFHTENNYSYYSSSYSADKRPLPPTHTHVQHKPTLNWKWLGSRWWISVCFIIYSLNSKLHFIFISFRELEALEHSVFSSDRLPWLTFHLCHSTARSIFKSCGAAFRVLIREQRASLSALEPQRSVGWVLNKYLHDTVPEQQQAVS